MSQLRTRAVAGPTQLDALALAADLADDVVVGTVQDLHDAVSDRAYGVVGRLTGGRGRSLPHRVHGLIAGGVFSCVSGGLRLGSAGLRVASSGGVPSGGLDDSSWGRFVAGAVNGLIGDQLREDAHPMSTETSLRVAGRSVGLDRDAVRAAYPDAGGKVVVFVHGLCGTEDLWWRPTSSAPTQPHEASPRLSYGDRLREDGWTPVYVRVNTGLAVAENGVALAAILQRLVELWPVELRRLALVGHSMGGLVIRAAGAVSTAADPAWTARVSDVVCLGTPHLGAPLERAVERGVRLLDRLPEAAPWGRILEFRSVGILDLRHGLSRDVQNLPHARYRLVGATLSRRRDGLGAESLGDLLVPFTSATGREQDGTEMFPGAETLHVRGGHVDLLNHAQVHDALRRWLADRDDAPTHEAARAEGCSAPA